MKLSLLIFMLTMVVSISSAQQKFLTSPWQFHSFNIVGLLEGQAGSAFQIQTINGAQYRSWFGGIGLGLDYYRYRTIPLFFDLRKEFGRNANKIFLYSDFGVNFSWITDKQKMSYVTEDKYGNDFYTDLGFGYKIELGKNNGLLLSLGYSFKKITETYISPIYYYTYPPGNDHRERINNSLNRLSIKLGWVF